MPRYEIRCVGDDLTLECESVSKVKWFFNGNLSVPSNMKLFFVRKGMYALKGHSLTFDNRGKYSCYGEEQKNNYIVDTTILDVIGEKLHTIIVIVSK